MSLLFFITLGSTQKFSAFSPFVGLVVHKLLSKLELGLVEQLRTDLQRH